jgi:hypothetical protein
MTMRAAEIRDLVRAKAFNEAKVMNDHGITLSDALVPPQRISIIDRTIQKGHLKDNVLSVWLIGQERSADGYRIVMREDGPVFGLASTGFPADRHLVLVGWYGDLISAFMSM